MALYGRSVQGYRGKRNFFDLSYNKVFDGDIGKAYPAFFEEVLPGDVWKCAPSIVVKFPTLNEPVFQKFHVKWRVFAVYNRVINRCFAALPDGDQANAAKIWVLDSGNLDYGETPWEHFITGGKTGTDVMHEQKSVDPSAFSKHSLYDYVGIPPLDGDDWSESAMGILGLCGLKVSAPYYAIYNAFFRNENFQDEKRPEADGSAEIFSVNWAKDRYTAALAEQQRGVAPELSLPDDLLPPVFPVGYVKSRSSQFGDDFYPLDIDMIVPNYVQDPSRKDLSKSHPFVGELDGSQGIAFDNFDVDGSGRTYKQGFGIHRHGSQEEVVIGDGASFLSLPLGAKTGVTTNPIFDVSDLRLMFQTQKFLEMNERVGYRYVEQLAARFGVRPQDSRVDRPIYLGGGSQDVIISQVNATDGDNVGKFRAQGVSAGRGKPIVFRSKEHGWIVCLVYVTPEATYGQRIDPQFFVKTKFDYFTPEFAHLSEQPVFEKELFPDYCTVDGAKSDFAFGFQGIYDEYRSKQSMVCGNFRAGQNLEDWTCQRSFTSSPTLSDEFLKVPTFRNLFVSENPDDPPLYFFVHNDLKTWRKLPKYATPGLIDHA